MSMDGLFTLLSLSIVMAMASFLAGILPLSLKLSQSQLRLISTVGMGVLVGTSLIVIIPEGVETLYSSGTMAHAHRKRDVIATSGSTVWEHVQVVPVLIERTSPDSYRPAFDMPGPVIPESLDKGPPETSTKPGVISITGTDTKPDSVKQHTEEKSHDRAHHAWIGVALIAGFILMFLVDKVPQYTSASKPKPKTHHIALNNLGRRFNLTTTLDREEESEGFLGFTPSSVPENRSFATTIGLVIHAAADGIALGASSSTSNSGLSLVIFFAIMVHKAPAAFGLTSVLLKQGLSKRMARAHLFMFSLAAPAGALLTWMAAHLLGGRGTSNPERTQWWTGMLLLFSAGTFLYVAMHSMQEVTAAHHESSMNGHVNGSVDGREVQSPDSKPSLRDLGAACFGMILPLFLQVGHAH